MGEGNCVLGKAKNVTIPLVVTQNMQILWKSEKYRRGVKEVGRNWGR